MKERQVISNGQINKLCQSLSLIGTNNPMKGGKK
jgi:hypothetical protein